MIKNLPHDPISDIFVFVKFLSTHVMARFDFRPTALQEAVCHGLLYFCAIFITVAVGVVFHGKH